MVFIFKHFAPFNNLFLLLNDYLRELNGIAFL